MAERHNSKTSHISCASEMVMRVASPTPQGSFNGDIIALTCAMNSMSSQFGNNPGTNPICTTCDRRSDDPVARCCVAANCGRLDRLEYAA